MITFKEKIYSEYDAMRLLYNELKKKGDSTKFSIIRPSDLPVILKGNSVVVEKFTIKPRFFGKDYYRMYIKVGAKAKMPDEIRMPKYYYDNKLMKLSMSLSAKSQNQNQQNQTGQQLQQITYSRSKSGGGNNQQGGSFNPKLEFSSDISITSSRLLGDAVIYDKKSRSLVLDFENIEDSIGGLNLLPFGLNYRIYLLD